MVYGLISDFFFEVKFRNKKMPYFGKFAKNFFYSVKKSNFNFQNRGIMGKKCSANFLKLRSELVYRNVIHDFSAKILVTFLS